MNITNRSVYHKNGTYRYVCSVSLAFVCFSERIGEQWLNGTRRVVRSEFEEWAKDSEVVR